MTDSLVEIVRKRLANGLHVSDADVHQLVEEIDRLTAVEAASRQYGLAAHPGLPDDEQTLKNGFLAYTKRYGWLVVRATDQDNRYLSTIGHYAIMKANILAHVILPKAGQL